MNSKISPPTPDIQGFNRLAAIVRQLRSPQGCPWDREQTPESLRAALIEETYEAVEAINEKEPNHIREELGDAYLMITMIGAIYEEHGVFSLEDIFRDVSEKLVRRHPHVYGGSVAEDPRAVAKQWQEIKTTLEGRKKKEALLDQVSSALPPLERAYKLQKKAAKAGFDWTEVEPVWDKISEELAETRQAWQALDSSETTRDHLEEEIGDLLFSVVNVARFLKIDPAIALHRTNQKFHRRFGSVETAMKAQNLPMDPGTFEIMDRLWEEAKKAEKATAGSPPTPE